MITCAIIFLLGAIHIAEPHCSFTFNECHCKDIHIDDFLDEFYKNLPEDMQFSSDFALSIEHSIITKLDYIPPLPVNISSIKIESSFLKTIGEDTFNEFGDLKELDLSGNKLRSLGFVKHLPSLLQKLDLSKNSIGYIDDVFQNLNNLKYLDLSYNNISIFDFTAVANIPSISLFANKISRIIPAVQCGTINTLNVSRNYISSFNETAIGCIIDNLDISSNNLTSLEVSNEKISYNLSGNNLKELRSSFNTFSVFQNLDLTAQTGDFSSNWKIVAQNQLRLGNNNIPYLSNDTLSLRPMMDRSTVYSYIDLSNSSIQDITEYYFSYFRLPLLNLSKNSLSSLRSNLFYGCKIETLDISFNEIKSIKYQTFSQAAVKFLDLSHNEIEIIKDVFEESRIEKIDLSFNRIKTVFGQSFENTLGVKSIRLSDCGIELIEGEAFFGLPELDSLDLSYNKLHVLEANTFHNLSITSLDLFGNNITTIKSKAFNNLFNLKRLSLLNTGVKTLEVHAFFNLPITQEIDLRNNHINSIPRDLFFKTKNLSKILLAGNNVTHLNPISNKLKIEYLSLSFNGILKSRTIMNTNLRYLVIEDSDVKILKPNVFDGLFNLKELYFTGSNVYFVEPGALNHLYGLKYLDTQNFFRYTTIIKKNTFKDLKSLELLHLSSLSLEAVDAFCFVGLKNLKTLLLDDNQLTELNKDSLYGLDSLRFLDLSLNKFEVIDNEILSGLDNLQELYLNNNNLISFNAQLPALKFLHLEYNNMSVLSKESFLSFNHLEELFLNHNRLEQISVGVFQNLTRLKMLNLSYNEIKNVKNGELSNLKQLTKLDMSYNGIIKIENESVFYALRALNELYLDNNHLKEMNFETLARNLPKLNYVGISLNKWRCDTLSLIIDNLNRASISYEPLVSILNEDNINGVSCIDICKFLLCPTDQDGTFQMY